ncbi:MAG: hypothetical protein WBN93_13950, partial [Acidimicrobiia bacterium]
MIADIVGACGGGPFGFSRALAPEIRRGLRESPAAEELPAVRGRTVIPTAYRHPVVVGHPNYLGVFEREPERAMRLVYLTGLWSALQPVPEGAAIVVVAPSHPRPLATTALDKARDLAKHARQIPGVHLAIRPRSPILVLLLPKPIAGNVLPETACVLNGAYPEFPGGLRVELTPDMTTVDVTRYAAILE